jgi:UDP-N-acetylglucosamine 4,6-dehydratase
VALSTDKASSPLGVYGAAKLLSDKLFVAANRYSKTKFAIIRYGNVVASNGSIIQKMGNSEDNLIEITDRTMTRFWITKTYAAKLTIHLMKHMNGDEILVPKIPAMNVLAFLKCMKPKAQIVDVPIRPAEKIDESMILQEDARTGLEFEPYYIIYPRLPDKAYRTFAGVVGKELPDGFTYTSGNNPVTLYDEEFAKMLLNDTFKFPELN